MNNWLCVLCLVLLPCFAQAQLHHDLEVTLNPGQHRLEVNDTLSWSAGAPAALEFSLHAALSVETTTPGAQLTELTAGTDPAALKSRRYRVTLPAGESQLELSLRVASASWLRPQQAVVYVDGAPVRSIDVPVEQGRATDVRLDVRLPVPPHDAWVVCVVTGPGVGGRFWPQLNDYTLAATNPVLLDVDGEGEVSAITERVLAAAEGLANS